MQVASKHPLWCEPIPAGQTVLVVRASAASMTAFIKGGDLAPGSREVTINWGDGTKQKVPRFDALTHTYSNPREYRVVISDDLQSFAYRGGDTDEQGQMLAEMLSAGTKIKSIPSYGFNHCRSMRGKMEFPGVTSIGGYAFGSLGGVTELSFPSLTRLSQTAFYWGPSATTMYADRVTGIDSQFWGYYGGRLVDLYIRGKTRSQIKAMSGFPFKAGASVRFHGSDGIVLGNGQFV